MPDNSNNKSKSKNPIIKKIRKWTIIGSVMTILGGLLYFTFPGLLRSALKSQLQIKDGNDFTTVWKKNPFPIRIDIYVFNIDNPSEFADGAKAKLRQLGPYSYDFWIYKEIVSFSADQKRVKFRDSQSFHFRPDLSSGQLEDKVRVLNFPVYALANLVRNIMTSIPLSFAITPVAFGFVNILFMTHGESMIKETTVGELLNGYPFSILDTIDTLTKPLTWFGIELPDTGMPDNKFGFLWTKNFTKGGPYEAYTGQGDTEVLQIIKYKDKSVLDFYSDPQCQTIKGTEGSTLGVGVEKSKNYFVFTADTCRPFDLVYQKNSWVNGIPTYRFIPNPLLFASPTKNPINKCFCHTPENEEMCDGVFDLSRCLDGAPAAYSSPHFLSASLAILNNVENMNPTEEKHRPYVDVEPFMGAIIRAAEKIQMNALLKPIPYLAGFRNVRDTILPLIWFEKSAVIDDKFTLQMRMAIWPVYIIVGLIKLTFFGGIIILVTVAVYAVRKRQKMSTEMNNVENVKNITTNSRSDSTEPLQQSFQPSAPPPLLPSRYVQPPKVPSTSQSTDQRVNQNVQLQQPEPMYWQIGQNGQNMENNYSIQPNRVSRRIPRQLNQQPNQSNSPIINPNRRIRSQSIRKNPIRPTNGPQQQKVVPETQQPINKNENIPNSVDNNSLLNEQSASFDSKLDFLDLNWTSINDVVIKQDTIDEDSEDELDKPQIKKSDNNNRNNNITNQRFTWSPPGSAE